LLNWCYGRAGNVCTAFNGLPVGIDPFGQQSVFYCSASAGYIITEWELDPSQLIGLSANLSSLEITFSLYGNYSNSTISATATFNGTSVTCEVEKVGDMSVNIKSLVETYFQGKPIQIN